ncbi:hypothetical protein D3C78_1066220 [compost metagenome]
MPVTFRRMPLSQGVNAAQILPASRAAKISACARHGATNPHVWPSISLHSPMALTPGCEVCIRLFTTIPLAHNSPLAFASEALGTTPVASTTRVAARVRPSESVTV